MHDESLAAFGKRLAALRAKRRLTQREVARRAAVDLNTVSRIERGIGDTTYATMIAIARALDVRVVDLLGSGKLPESKSLEELSLEVAEAKAIAKEALRLARFPRRTRSDQTPLR